MKKKIKKLAKTIAKKLLKKLRKIKKRYEYRYCMIYLGEGATGISEEIISENRNLQIQKERGGTMRYMVHQKAQKDSRIYECFYQEEAELLGYYVRRKEDNIWKWYAQDGCWYSSTEYASDGTLKKRLFHTGELIGDCIDLKRAVYLSAQWKNRLNGEQMRPGYPIFRHALMAHALGGGAVKQTYANTREALEESYAAGIRYFEVDVDVTEDGRMVLSHGWSSYACQKTGMVYQPEFEHMTWEMFKRQTVSGMHTMDIVDLQQYMTEHPDTWFEIDFHRSNVVKKVKVLVEEFKGKEYLLDRLLIQGGDQKICKAIDHVCHFKNYQMILRPEWLDKLEAGVIDFALENGIETIAIRHALFQDFHVRLFHEAGFNVMVYTIQEDARRASELLAMGVDAICTDFLLPGDIEKVI